MSDGSWIRIGATKVHLDAKTINPIISDMLNKKYRAITKDPDLRVAIGDEYIKQVTDYVPMKTGKLRESGRATNDGRVYWTATSPKGFNYANIQYNHEFEHYTTEGTHSHWTDFVQPGTQEWSDFISNITPIILRRIRDGQR